MNETITVDKIRPEWLKREVLEELVSGELEDTPEKAESELTLFLQTRGREIWNSFMVDGRSPQLLLNEEGGKRVRDEIKEVFGEADDVSGAHRVAQRARWMTATLLLVAGFAVIGVTYWRLPALARSFQEDQANLGDSELALTMRSIRGFLESDSFTALGDQLATVGTELRGLDSELDVIETLPTALRGIQGVGVASAQQLEASSAQLMEQLGQLERVSSAAVLAKPDEAATDLPADSAAAATSAPKPQLDRLEQSLSSIVGRIREGVDPQDLNTAIDAAKAEVEAWREAVQVQDDAAAQLLTTFCSSWDRGEKNSARWSDTENLPWKKGRTEIIERESSAIEAIFRWHADEEARASGLFGAAVPDTMTRLEGLVSILHGQEKLVLIEGQTRSDLEELVRALKDMSAELRKTSQYAGTLEGARVSLVDSLKSIRDSKEIKRMTEESVGVFQSIDRVMNIVEQTRASHENAKNQLENVREATEAARSIASMQTELAFKGSSPAVLLLFAIGGMFVTFGLSSLLKWVRALDERREELTWQSRARLQARISAAFLESGVDPIPFVAQMQSMTVRASESRRAFAPQTPVTNTVSELGKMIGGRHGS